MAETRVTMQTIYKKLNHIEERLDNVEKRLVPEVELSEHEMKALEKIRKDIKKGNVVSEKELFAALAE